MNVPRQIIDVGLWLLECGLVTGTAGNISVRCPREEAFLITPSGRDYRLLLDRDLVRVDLGTGKTDGRWRPSTEWRLHAAIYLAREDVGAIIHHHSTFASAVAVARKTIPVLLDESADVGPIPTVAYAPSGSQELAEAAAACLAGGGSAILLANHGVVVVGRDLGEARRRAYEVERLSKIYVGAELLGGAHALDQAAIARSQEFLKGYLPSSAEKRTGSPSGYRTVGHVGFLDVVNFGFRTSMTFISLLHALILQRLHR